MNRDAIRHGFPGAVPVLRVVKMSGSASHKILFGRLSVPGLIIIIIIIIIRGF